MLGVTGLGQELHWSFGHRIGTPEHCTYGSIQIIMAQYTGLVLSMPASNRFPVPGWPPSTIPCFHPQIAVSASPLDTACRASSISTNAIRQSGMKTSGTPFDGLQ